MTDDRTKSQQTDSHVSDTGLSDDLCSFLAEPVANKPGRTRALLSAFRPTPGSSSGLSIAFPDGDRGFPGTKAFSSHSSDRGAAGATLQPKTARTDAAPAPVAGSDDSSGRCSPIQPTGSGSAAVNGAAQPADQGPGRRGLRGRPPGSGKKKQTEAGLPKDIAKLVPKSDTPSPSKIIPTEAERSDARRLFREIGETFNSNRKKSKTAAYAAFRHDLMANLDTLIMGGAIDLKEATSIITNLEQYTKETEAESTETPATILGRWLRMEPGEVGELEARGPSGEEEPDEAEDEENSGEEVDELDAATDVFHAADSHAVS